MQLFHKKPTQVTSLKFPKRFQRIDALANKLKKFPKLFFWVWWQPLDASRRIGKKESILARPYLKPQKRGVKTAWLWRKRKELWYACTWCMHSHLQPEPFEMQQLHHPSVQLDCPLALHDESLRLALETPKCRNTTRENQYESRKDLTSSEIQLAQEETEKGF